MMGSNRTNRRNGFTIIEVMLFLGITGILIASIMVGAAANINSQRYRDTVEQVRNIIQGQFDKTYSLTNNNASSSGNVNPCSTGHSNSVRHRGSTNCLYVGRAIEIESNSSTGTSSLRISPLIAEPIGGESMPYVFDSATDSMAGVDAGNPVRGYEVFQHTDNEDLIEERQVDWNLGIFETNGSDSMQDLSIIIIRSPINGAISTRVIPGNIEDSPDSLSTIIASNAYRQEAKLCIGDAGGELEPLTRMAVVIRKDAAGPGAVESLGDNSGC